MGIAALPTTSCCSLSSTCRLCSTACELPPGATAPEITSEAVDPAEFRWRVEAALDARMVHDSALIDDDSYELPVDEDGPGFPALAVLMRKRMKALPVPGKPRLPHGQADWR